MPSNKDSKGRNVLVFLAFLVASFSLWLIKVADENTETDVTVGIIVTNVPQDVRLPEEIELEVGVKAKGGDILSYFFGEECYLQVDYHELTSNEGTLTLPTSLLESRVEEALPKDIHVKGFKENLLVIEKS